jgi:ribosome-binding protein aMBF1 (putative translation factor)
MSSEKPEKRDSRERSSIGPWLRRARIKRNTTQAELARELETEQSMIAMVETGDAQPSAALERRMRAWIRAGQHPSHVAPRGPYRK